MMCKESYCDSYRSSQSFADIRTKNDWWKWMKTDLINTVYSDSVLNQHSDYALVSKNLKLIVKT